MSGKVAADYCEAVEAEFAWFARACMKSVVKVVDVDGDKFGVCAEHAKGPTS